MTATAYSIKNEKLTAYLSLTFFILVAFNNSLQHLYWQFSFAVYAPGVIAAAFLVIPSVLFLSWHAIANGLVSAIYIAVIYLASFSGLITSYTMGRTIAPEMAAGLEAAARLANLVGIGP